MTEPNPEPTGEPESNPIGEVFEQLTAAERFVGLGAALVLVSWLVGQILVNHYSVDDVAIPLAIGVLGGIFSFFKGRTVAWHSLYPWIVAVAAIAIAILGFNRFLEDLRFSYLGGSAWLWRTLYYAGAGFLGYGGVLLLNER